MSPPRKHRNQLEEIVLAALMVCLLNADSSPAQSTEEETREENALESVLTNSDDPDEIFRPLDINRASEDDLMSITGMTPECASSIVNFRKKMGRIGSTEALAGVPGMTPELLSALMRRTIITDADVFKSELMSYVSVSPQRLPLYRSAYGDHGVLNFQGLELTYEDIKLHALTDKDPGEGNYLDFISAGLEARDFMGMMDVNLGDYVVSLGNGLLFSSGGTISKSAGAVSPLFSNRACAVRIYRSKGENRFLRGAALSLPLGDFETTVFASSKSLSAGIDSTGDVSSIDYSGLRLSDSAPRGKLGERIAGGILRYSTSSVAAGFSTVHFSYDRDFQNGNLSRTFAFESFGRFYSDNVTLSGEILFDGLPSFTGGISLNYGPARFAVGLRSLRSRIVQNYSGPISESYPTKPERGVYFGTTLRPLGILTLGFYLDRFHIAGIDGEPEKNGEEIFVDSYISLSRKKLFEGTSTVVYVRYKYKTKEDPFVVMTDLPAALTSITGCKQSARMDFRHRFGSRYTFRVKYEKNFISTGEKGDLLQFDTGLRSEEGGVNAGICFYRTDSFRSAFYSVERELPHVAQFSALYGDGARLYVLFNWKMASLFGVGVKIARDIYGVDREISVGGSAISTPGETEIGVELSWNIETTP